MDSSFSHESTPLLSSDHRPPGDISPSSLLVSFENISLSIEKKRCLSCPGSSSSSDHHSKPILVNLSGHLQGLVAVIGSSGAGKTSMMDVLANRRLASNARFSGSVLVNGLPRNGFSFKRMCAYITQDDVLHSSLTVYECLSFAARLMLPPAMSFAQKMERVDQVIALLNLQACAHTQIGGPFLRGISGGEMRRVSIGLEILTHPSLLLADEVTSGLDSYSAWSVISVLAKMRNTTTVVNIHQPSSAIFDIFTSIILMAKGHIIYQGAIKDVLEYFHTNFNLTLPPGWAIADFLLDIVSQRPLSASAPQLLEEEVDSLPHAPAPWLSSSESIEEHDLRMAQMAHIFQSSTHWQQWQHQMSDQVAAPALDTQLLLDSGANQFANNWLVQFWVLFCRHILLWRRDYLSILGQFISYVVSGIVIGAMFSNIKVNQDEQLTLAISFSLDVFGIMSFLQIGIFLKERLIFDREVAGNYYQTSAYFLSKTLATFPILFLVGLPFVTILYFWIGFADGSFSNYLFFLLVCYMTQLTMAGMIEAIGCTFKSLDTALVVAGTLNVLTMTLSGVTSNFPNLLSYLKPFYWMTPLTYATSALLVMEFEDTPDGQAWLQEMGVQITDRWENIWILAIFLIAFRIITYFPLRFLHRL